jgi:hypothetical protein
MTVTVYLRANQSAALSWSQVDGNFTALATQVNTNTADIAALGGAQGGPTSSRPSVPTLYQYYVDTTLGYPVWCTVVSPPTWVNAAGVAS